MLSDAAVGRRRNWPASASIRLCKVSRGFLPAQSFCEISNPPLEAVRLAKQASITSGMAGRYASALFALAEEQGALAAVAADLDAFSALLDESADLRRLVRSPAFSAEEQARALAAVLAKAGISGLSSNFVMLVAKKRRLFAIADMIGVFHAMLDQKRGVARAEITIAEPLSAAHMATIKDALRQAAGAQSVEVAVKIDPAIIGGLVVRIGSRMVDGSLRAKLNSLRTRMKEIR
jgi:F-type H+-transporting ATPase subunit delta